MIEIEIQNPNSFEIPNADDIKNWCVAALQDSVKCNTLLIRFVDTEESTELNFAYRNKNTATNVLSFSYDLAESFEDLIPEAETRHLGDLVLCAPLLNQEAKEQHKTTKQHLAHLLVHGVLHLQGYDHIDDELAEIMESLEIKTLRQLGFDNPYLDS